MEQNAFSVSEQNNMQENNTPLSVFSMQFTAMEIEQALLLHAKPTIRKLKRNAAIIGVLGLVIGFLLFDFAQISAVCMISISVCFLTYFFAAIHMIKKNAKKNASEAEQTKDVYEIFDNHMKITIYEKETLKSIRYIDYEEIDSYNENESYFFFVRKNHLYLFRKNDPACSIMIDKIRNDARCELEKNLKKENKKDILSAILLLLNLFSLLVPMVLRNFLSYDILDSLPTQIELFFLVIPVGVLLASIVLRKKIKFKGVILITILSSVLLCCFAATNGYLAEAEDYTYDEKDIAEELIEQAETQLGINLPDNYELQYAYERESSFYSAAYLNLDENTAEAFGEIVKNNDLWLDYAPSILEGLKDYNTSEEYSLLYNIDTKQFNALPENNGTYKFLLLTFSEEYSNICITRYEAEYTEYIEK